MSWQRLARLTLLSVGSSVSTRRLRDFLPRSDRWDRLASPGTCLWLTASLFAAMPWSLMVFLLIISLVVELTVSWCLCWRFQHARSPDGSIAHCCTVNAGWLACLPPDAPPTMQPTKLPRRDCLADFRCENLSFHLQQVSKVVSWGAEFGLHRRH